MGLRDSPLGLSRKSTGFASNSPEILALLVKFQCDNGHDHVPLQSGLPGKARVYPRLLCEAVADGVEAEVHGSVGTGFLFPVKGEQDEEGGEEPEGGLDSRATDPPADEAPTQEEVRLLKKFHINCGHPPTERLARALTAAGVKPHLIRYAAKAKLCEACAARHGQVPRRHVTLPRTFGDDFFYVVLASKTCHPQYG